MYAYIIIYRLCVCAVYKEVHFFTSYNVYYFPTCKFEKIAFWSSISGEMRWQGQVIYIDLPHRIQYCILYVRIFTFIEGSLEVKLPTIWTAEKQRWEESEKRREEERERVRRKKIQVREKVGKSRNTLFFQWFDAPEGRKVGSLKRRVQSQLARWEMKKCTPLWREVHFQVKMHKTHHARTTFGNWDVEKVHAVVARSTFASEKAKNTSRSEHFWKLRCRKSARHCGAKHISKSKCTKHTRSGPLLEVEMSKKCTILWREAHLEVNMYKTLQVRTTSGRSDVVSRGRHKGLCTLSKVSKMWGFCSISKNDGRRGTFEEDLQRWIFRGRRSTRDMFIRAVRRSGLLRWFYVTGSALRMTWHHFFVAGAVL